ncbi:unnamed protein product, partial [Prorocentrum cordatum]
SPTWWHTKAASASSLQPDASEEGPHRQEPRGGGEKEEEEEEEEEEGGQPRQERRARLRLGGARGRTDGRQLPARRRGRKRRCPAASCTARPWRRRGWCWRPRGHGRNTWASPLAPAPPHTASTSHPAPPRRAAGALPRDLRCTRSARRRRSGRGRPTPGRPVGTRLLAHRPAPLALPRQIGAWHQPPRGPPRRPWSGP